MIGRHLQGRYQTAAELGRLVSRQEEIEAARASWMRARGGDGLTLLVSGESGIGNSRFIHEIRTFSGRLPIDMSLELKLRIYLLQYGPQRLANSMLDKAHLAEAVRRQNLVR